jgi:hypothetical protein|tara:strand:+ start:454 stop:600 length:147 start_codon:yes stop_codon:yes gene_type:complete
MIIKKLPKLDAVFHANIKGITMKKWADLIKTGNEKKVIFDKASLIEAQ